jgi:hypothetical protein
MDDLKVPVKKAAERERMGNYGFFRTSSWGPILLKR